MDAGVMEIEHPISGYSAHKLNTLESHLRTTIHGQEHVLQRVCSVLKRGQLGLRKPDRPLGSFLFLGPTGVGKTELALEFSRYLFGPGRLFRFDMSEYQTSTSIGLLLGSRPGEPGLLREEILGTGQTTLLFDEIEKAHPSILDVFLQILDAARVTTSSGTTLDFSRCYVVFTSNLGCSDVIDVAHSGVATLERHALAMARQHFRPELFARIQEKLVFRKLDYDVQLQIARKFLETEIGFLRGKGFRVEVSERVFPFLVREGFHPKLGARPLRDAVERLIGDAVAADLLAGGTGSGRLDVVQGGDSLELVPRLSPGGV
ncbi:MAG: hypothetical protein RLZZ399_1335 [Verrucomicrobiota bacterium]|jgi:ATP-dependent Clp protease ATP-binding subunit ClpB